MKKSRLGTQFFAHKATGECTTAPETEQHLRLKRLVVEVARANGWEAQTEVSEGVLWRADVLASKGSARVAVEIQWSSQTDDETLRRQRRYADSGVRGLWLLRQKRFPIDADLPAARVSAQDEGFFAHLPGGGQEQALPIAELLSAAFTRRLQFGLPVNFPAQVTINVGSLSCWSCGADTDILTNVAIDYGPNEYRYRIIDLEQFPEIWAIVRDRLPQDLQIGLIRSRPSRTMERSYLSNGCAHCDALIGQHYEHEAWHDQRAVASFEVTVDEAWRRILMTQASDAWGVYRASARTVPPS